ncbi:PEP-CTERM sorting domain-containing protein [Thiohalorhabdus methylotrophus]|uniref:PEP-CTERM sorting domain-containing protein n=1 Tax=Thiohalorhabdus methylotrophus TaxID=3242694 RepID=A0ABV4TYN5_9GAMM
MSDNTAIRLVGALALSAGLGLAGNAQATLTWDFTGAGGDLSKTETFDDITSTAQVTAHAINTEEPPEPVLNQDGEGLGVDLSDSFDGSLSDPNGPDGTILPDEDQIDNRGDDEGIVFDFGSMMQFENISIASASGGILSEPDAFEIWGTNDSSVTGCTSGGLSCLTGVSTSLGSGSGDSMVDLTGMDSYQYLIATVPGGSGDDYRVASLEANQVPAPATLGLLGLGLAGMGLTRGRKRKS